METFEESKRWADQFMPEIKTILGLYLIGEASEEDDMKRNTDLIVLKMDGVRIAVRVRKKGYAEMYGDEFTIRTKRPSGTKTEIDKIIEGWGDYFFYGHEGEALNLSAWALCNLKVFRGWVSNYLWTHKTAPGEKRANRDGSSSFHVFRFDQLPDDFVVARKTYRGSNP